MARAWILTGSPENDEATRAHGFAVIGPKGRNRARWPEVNASAGAPA